MSDTIVIGIDGSERSRDAVALGQLLARAWGASALLVAVHPFEHADWGGAGPVYAAAVGDAETHLAEAAQLLGDAGAVETRALGCSSPARGLQALAEQAHASAIVVGSTHRGAIGRVLPGGVGERLLHGAPCPVAIAPRGFGDRDDPPLRRIGVAYVSGPEGTRAVQMAASLAGDVGGDVVVMTAFDPIPLQVQLAGGGLGSGSAAGFDQATCDEIERAGRERLLSDLADVETQLPSGLPHETRLLEGEPVEALAAASAELDLLVCGSRGYGPLRSVLVGGVSDRLIGQAACPVMVVPRGAGPARPIPPSAPRARWHERDPSAGRGAGTSPRARSHDPRLAGDLVRRQHGRRPRAAEARPRERLDGHADPGRRAGSGRVPRAWRTDLDDLPRGLRVDVREHPGRRRGDRRGARLAVVRAVHEAGAPDEGVTLLVAGGPTHMHGLASSMSRRMAAEAAQEDAATHVEPGATQEPGLRRWLKDLSRRPGVLAAAFDTRLDRSPHVAGSAARAIARRLRHHGYEVIGTESFLVEDSEGPLLDGELERARAWGAELARLAAAPDGQEPGGPPRKAAETSR